MKIHLRKRVGQLSTEKLNKGKKLMASLYLTYQEPKQKVRYEWLNLQIFENPKTNVEKEHNKETMLLAENIRAKRLLDMQSVRNGHVSAVKGKISFLDYFKKLVDKKREESEGNYGNWLSTYHHLKTYSNGRDYTLEQIDELYLEGFKEYLMKNVARRGIGKLNPNTGMSYYNKVRAALREAYRNRMIKENPANRVKGMKGEEAHRQFLTLEELQKLAALGCENDLLKRAFLFSALTGLRWSDVKAMTWRKIQHSEADGWSIQYAQQKTKGVEFLPVSEEAIKVLGDRNEDDKEIFGGLAYHTWMNAQLQDWVNRAGIKKKITFHCARHSFATLQLTMDTDIYTVSKMLGHRHLKTTEIYGKIIDKKKITAARRLDNVLSL